MVDLIRELRGIVRAFHAAGLEYAICGGIAVVAHGAPRATKDIDVLVRETDAGRALALVAPLGFDVPAEPMTFGAGTPGERKVQRVSKVIGAELLTLDLLLATPRLVGVLESRIEATWEGMHLSLVSRDGLAEMKRLAGRHQDLADLERLGLDDV